ncbi:MAG: RNA polymerase sigma factor WhiG [Actinomycetia bacterium]|nr:RNA polymerase sigma factor WhiG [Actinomycetes bacterium]
MQDAHDVMDAKEELQLWKKYKSAKKKDIEVRNFFINKYAPLVKYVAGKISISMPDNVEFDDLVSYGIFGLIDAIEKFDPNRGIQFKTYALLRIRGSIFDELRSIDWIPRSIRQKAKNLENVMITLEARLGRPPEDNEIADEMDITEDELKKLFLKINGISLVSLNDIWFVGDNKDEIAILDTIESPEALNPDYILEKEELKGIIVERIKSLPDKEKKVIVLYYYEDLTLKEIGDVLEVTESRVSQLHTKAILRLRGKLGRMKTHLSKK